MAQELDDVGLDSGLQEKVDPQLISQAKNLGARRRSITVGSQEIEVAEKSKRNLTSLEISWSLSLDGTDHVIVLKHGQFSGKRKITIDGVMVHDSRKFLDNGSQHEFDIENPGHPTRKLKVVIDLTRVGFGYKLQVDGADLDVKPQLQQQVADSDNALAADKDAEAAAEEERKRKELEESIARLEKDKRELADELRRASDPPVQ